MNPEPILEILVELKGAGLMLDPTKAEKLDDRNKALRLCALLFCSVFVLAWAPGSSATEADQTVASVVPDSADQDRATLRDVLSSLQIDLRARPDGSTAGSKSLYTHIENASGALGVYPATTTP